VLILKDLCDDHHVKWGRRIASAVLGCAVIVPAVWLAWPAEREPVYKGKTLSQWFRGYEGGYSNETQRIAYKAANAATADALQHMGTNALPCLLHWLAYERQPPWQDLVRKLPWRIGAKLCRGEKRAWESEMALRELGPTAVTAVPELARLALSPHRDVRSRAMYVLAHVGEPGFKPLLASLEAGNSEAASYICQLAEVGVDVRPALPPLLLVDHEIIKSQLLHPQLCTFKVVYGLKISNELFVSALTNCLTHSNPIVRLQATSVLGECIEESASAVAALDLALTDSDETVRQEATNALRLLAKRVVKAELEKAANH
jgi:hypothetical protein